MSFRKTQPSLKNKKNHPKTEKTRILTNAHHTTYQLTPKKEYREGCKDLTLPNTNSVLKLIKGGFRLESIPAEWVHRRPHNLGYPAATRAERLIHLVSSGRISLVELPIYWEPVYRTF